MSGNRDAISTFAQRSSVKLEVAVVASKKEPLKREARMNTSRGALGQGLKKANCCLVCVERVMKSDP